MKKDLLKGKVKRVLQEDSEIGQIGASALQSFATGVECFIKEIGVKMAQHAKENGLHVLTPAELKKSLQKDPSFDFLAEKLQAIDEEDTKYQKFHQQQRKRKTNPSISKPSPKDDKPTKKPKKESDKTKTNSKPPAPAASKAVPVVKKSSTNAKPTVVQVASTTIQEDSDYDESEEEEE